MTTLTKRTAEELTDYLRDVGINVRYLHSEIDAIERVEILRALRKGEFDVLVGINLLREGLDLPEVSLVAILDADKEGLPALDDEPDPDRRPRRAASQRRGHSLRRRADPEHPEVPRGLELPSREAAGVQPRARHHPAQRQPGGRGEPVVPPRNSGRRRRRSREAAGTSTSPRRSADSRPRCSRRRTTSSSRRPPCCAIRSAN